VNHYLDPSVLRGFEEISDPDEESLFAEIAEIFEQTTPEFLVQLKAAIRDANSEAVRQIAHRLKGSAANLGAKTLAELCSAAETTAKLNPLLVVQIDSEEIVEAYTKTCVEIAMYLASKNMQKSLPKKEIFSFN
jgi:HPt (histidine-containing phosphotransfer) domain-containing protein